MEKISGLVLEIGDNECTVLAPGNRYVRLRVPEQTPAIGEIVEGYPLENLHVIRTRPAARIWAYAASILITLILGGYKVYATPVAYVTLDMAPSTSVELALNSGGKVIKTKFNEGDTLHNKVNIQALPGDVNQALASLVKDAANLSSSTEPEDNLAVLTYTNSPYLKQDNLTNLMSAALQTGKYKGQLLVDSVDREFRSKAEAAKISAGQELILELAAGNRITLSTDELQKKGLSRIIKEHGLKLKALVDSFKLQNPDLNFSQISTMIEDYSRPDASSTPSKVTEPSPKTEPPVQTTKTAEKAPMQASSGQAPLQASSYQDAELITASGANGTANLPALTELSSKSTGAKPQTINQIQKPSSEDNQKPNPQSPPDKQDNQPKCTNPDKTQPEKAKSKNENKGKRDHNNPLNTVPNLLTTA